MDRREFLAGTGALILGGVAVDPARARRAPRPRGLPLARGVTFPQGVASGDPGERAVTLWTRPEGADPNTKVILEVAREPDFRRVVARRPVRVREDRDLTVEKWVGGLRPGSQYFYRFETADGSSPVGRFRTSRPADSREPVRIGVFTCQEWQSGYYGAHAVLAGEDVDVVVCLGDYVYEAGYPGPRKDTSGAAGNGEVNTLADYRSKYRLYKSDPDLRALHAAHPVVAIWDDHEVSNDYAADSEGFGVSPSKIPFPQRRRNAHRAFYEYMPFAPVAPRSRRGHDLYRARRLGANVELFLLDERQYRDQRPCGDVPLLPRPCPEAETGHRTMLGAQQLAWLKSGLQDSQATWKLIANQVMMMALEIAPATPLGTDQWDGYGAERRDILSHIEQRGIGDVVFVTGDYHAFFAGDVGVNGRGPGSVATEFLTGSLTSLSTVETAGNAAGAPLPPDVEALPLRAAVALNPHIKYVEERAHGYTILEAHPHELRARYVGVPIDTRSTAARDLAQFRVARGVPRVQRA